MPFGSKLLLASFWLAPRARRHEFPRALGAGATASATAAAPPPPAAGDDAFGDRIARAMMLSPPAARGAASDAAAAVAERGTMPVRFRASARARNRR